LGVGVVSGNKKKKTSARGTSFRTGADCFPFGARTGARPLGGLGAERLVTACKEFLLSGQTKNNAFKTAPAKNSDGKSFGKPRRSAKVKLRVRVTPFFSGLRRDFHKPLSAPIRQEGGEELGNWGGGTRVPTIYQWKKGQSPWKGFGQPKGGWLRSQEAGDDAMRHDCRQGKPL